MAPYIGVSLYTWTSIIGVVLAGMSVGKFFGGVVADRYASRRTLGLIFIAGGVAAWASSWSRTQSSAARSVYRFFRGSSPISRRFSSCRVRTRNGVPGGRETRARKSRA